MTYKISQQSELILLKICYNRSIHKQMRFIMPFVGKKIATTTDNFGDMVIKDPVWRG